VFTRPKDFREETIRAELAVGWGFRADVLAYQPVGFGSHHWLAADAAGPRLFVTIDDLAAILRNASDTTDAAFARLDRAFTSALSLRQDAGLEFVLAPVPDRDGGVLRGLSGGYSILVHLYLPDAAAADGRFGSACDVHTVAGLLVRLHAARAVAPRTDDFVIPRADELRAAMAATGQICAAGPYAGQARELLARQASGVEQLLACYQALAVKVAARPERMVITHGEPNAGNVLRTPSGYVFVDWESVLLAPPERDLWQLAEQDPGAADAYCAAGGVPVDADALALYRMWYDLFEIAGYISFFRAPHAATEDAAESWRNLRYFLRPGDRWPDLISG
jgi:spectinomycin phosphotransferase/16S rRNA (guanine(1405)-N(7))-methyltransferase